MWGKRINANELFAYTSEDEQLHENLQILAQRSQYKEAENLYFAQEGLAPSIPRSFDSSAATFA